MERLEWVSQNNADYYPETKYWLIYFLGFFSGSELLHMGGTASSHGISFGGIVFFSA
jgi:hypothetical protein